MIIFEFCKTCPHVQLCIKLYEKPPCDYYQEGLAARESHQRKKETERTVEAPIYLIGMAVVSEETFVEEAKRILYDAALREKDQRF